MERIYSTTQALAAAVNGHQVQRPLSALCERRCTTYNNDDTPIIFIAQALVAVGRQVL
jgi:hypothetical protein